MRLTYLRYPEAPWDAGEARRLRPLARSGVLAFPETVEYAAALEIPRNHHQRARARFWLALGAAVAYAACIWAAR